MYKNLEYQDTKTMTHDEWVEARKSTVGGSDAATICGLNPWSSAYELWCEKTGKAEGFQGNEATRLGQELEDYVARRFTEATGKKVHRRNAIIRNPDMPFAHANVDRMVVGEDAGLECKTTSSLNLKSFKNGEFPPTYYVQCMHYMAVTGAKKWYLAVLVLQKEFLWYEIERDEDEIFALMAQERDFYNRVLSDIAPAADGSDATSDALAHVYANDNGATIDLSAVGTQLLIIDNCKKQEKSLKETRQAAENTVKQFMGECSEGRSGGYKVQWKAQEKKSFDVKKFAQANPGIDLTPYYTTSTSRVFRFTSKKV